MSIFGSYYSAYLTPKGYREFSKVRVFPDSFLYHLHLLLCPLSDFLQVFFLLFQIFSIMNFFSSYFSYFLFFLIKFSIFFIRPLSTVIFLPLSSLLLNITLQPHQGWCLPIFFSFDQESYSPWFCTLVISCCTLHANIISYRILSLLYSSEDIC